MTQTEMIQTTIAWVGSPVDNAVALAALRRAGEKIINKCYPFRHDVFEVPIRYQTLQCEIAAYLINKRGAEGEIAHKENGIDRTYESAEVPESMLNEVRPFLEVY